MADEKKRPVFIKIEDSEDIELTGNTIFGDADFVHAKNVQKLTADGNVQMTSSGESPKEKPKTWHETGLGKIAVGLLVLLIGTAIVTGIRSLL
jgi:hypothetical protein